MFFICFYLAGCEDCDEALEMKCGRHEVKVISDKPILSRARATLPKEHLAINKLPGEASGEGNFNFNLYSYLLKPNNYSELIILGVFARKTIPKRVQFGPIEGILTKDISSKGDDLDGVELLLEVETGELLKLDVSDERMFLNSGFNLIKVTNTF